MILPWIEKHRPKVLDEVAGNKSIIEVLKLFAEDGSMPNLLVSGPPGTGKTTAITCMIRSLLKDRVTKETVLELNASDERGIDVVRTKIRSFLLRKLDTIRFVILDESDSMTSAAQQSMRRLIEKHPDSRFIFICNSIEKITESIQSRCAVLKYSELTKEDLKELLERICRRESISISQEAVDLISESSEGDSRQAINLLQTASVISKDITEPTVSCLINVPPISKVKEIIETSESNPSLSIELLDDLFKDGYSYEDVSKILFKCARDSVNLQLMESVSRLLLRVSEGCATHLQFYSLLIR